MTGLVKYNSMMDEKEQLGRTAWPENQPSRRRQERWMGALFSDRVFGRAQS